jgi:ferrochelatase
MRFTKEPGPSPRTAPATAILLCNLGTPEAPTTGAVRRYLAEFLTDPRVVEIPRLLWWFILQGVVLRVRPAKSAAKYATIWTPEGSPLTTWTDKQAKLLEGYLGERGHRVTVRFAMRYGQPAIGRVMDELKAGGARRILVLPLYPQYCSATTGSVGDAVFQWGRHIRSLPELRFVNRFHLHEGYLSALAKRVTDHWAVHGRPEKLVMSFHGMPQRTRTLGDPYHDECQETGTRLAERLGLKPADWQLTFQSRLGRAEWLQPYTEPTLVEMARQGIRRVDTICPGFVADNLETLEEINQEAREAFLHAGGIQHLQGWDTAAPPLPGATAMPGDNAGGFRGGPASLEKADSGAN